MSSKVAESETESTKTARGIIRRLDAAAWGAFFIWVGVALLMGLSWGIGLIGVAAIVFLKQAARMYYGRRPEAFSMVIGGFFLLGGIWHLYQIEVDLVPILLILVGGSLVLSLFHRPSRTGRWCRRFTAGAHDRRAPGRPDSSARPFEWCGWGR